MNPRRRDGLLAIVATAGIVTVAAWRGTLSALRKPGLFVAGAAGTLGLELLLAWYPEQSADIWADSRVQAGSTIGVVALALFATFFAPWLLAVLLGGLLCYFVLLILVLTEVIPGAEAWFDR